MNPTNAIRILSPAEARAARAELSCRMRALWADVTEIDGESTDDLARTLYEAAIQRRAMFGALRDDGLEPPEDRRVLGIMGIEDSERAVRRTEEEGTL